MLKIGIITMALFSFLQAGWFSNLFDNTPKSPITKYIDLSKKGSRIEFTTRIPKEYISAYKGRPYYIWLEFIYDNKLVKNGIWDSAIASKIAGYGYYPRNGQRICDKEFAIRDLTEHGVKVDDNYDCFGIVVTLHVVIYKINKDKTKTKVTDKTYKTKGTVGGWLNHMQRVVNRYHLSPGKYKIIVTNMEAIKEMKGRKADIRFGKSGTK